MSQLDLRLPMARKTDPDTSHEAADKHEGVLSERRLQVLSLVKAYPGATSGELARLMFSKLGGSLSIRSCVETPHKRLPELLRLGYVRMGAKRECGDSGYTATTWYSTPKGDRC